MRYYNFKTQRRRWIVEIPWSEVADIIGHEHNGCSADDDAIMRWLKERGAPSWLDTAEGFCDENCWGLIGPEVDD